MNILVIDIGGSKVKIWRTGETEPLKFASGSKLGPAAMVERTREIVGQWPYERVSLGYPGQVLHGQVIEEPLNLGDGWVGFDFERVLGRPVRIINDAAMQALGSYEGGRMLYLGLGTGVGTVLIVDGHIIPLHLGHLLLDKRGTLDNYLSRRGLERLGTNPWRRAVAKATNILKSAFLADYVVLGGGNVKKLRKLPEGCRRGGNEMALIGGIRVWERDEEKILDREASIRFKPSSAAS
jgi:predicted NBD/HSP70 family sugar kinase